jgi:thiol-disulfide isomerase/thioredoxin
MKAKLFVAIVCVTLLVACTKTDPNLVIITGQITNPRGESASFACKDTSYVASIKEDGTFEISFTLDSSKYFNFEHGVEVTAMYVKPGDRIHLTIDPGQFDETIAYEGSVTSSFLAKKYLLREDFDFYGEVYYLGSPEDYKSLLDEYKSTLFNELEATNDSAFIENERLAIGQSTDYYARRQEKFQEQYADYGEDARIYVMENSKLNYKYNFYTALDSLDSTEYDAMLEAYRIDVDALINKLTAEDYAKKQKDILEERIDLWRERKILTDNMPKAGEPAVDFTYPDIDGNEVSLSSLQGKLVYVDVWATWCGPCLGEIPSLQKLEQEYHGKNITFLSVSVDTDKEAWMKMVKEDELGGIQLWADGWSQITSDYAIFGIPRFMLFSADGKVISTDAPRPSSEKIRGLLDSNL